MVNAMHSGRSASLRDLNKTGNFETNYAYRNIHYVEIPKSGDRPECIAFTITSIRSIAKVGQFLLTSNIRYLFPNGIKI